MALRKKKSIARSRERARIETANYTSFAQQLSSIARSRERARIETTTPGIPARYGNVSPAHVSGRGLKLDPLKVARVAARYRPLT